MQNEQEQVYSCNEAAHALGISSDHLRMLARTGKIACNKLNHRFFVFTATQLEAYLDEYKRSVPYVPKGKQ
jgi:hypothetical protein